MDFFCSIPQSGRAPERDQCASKAQRLGKFFEVDKLFSELKTKHQRDEARKNLGIKEQYAWDDLTGDITEIPELRSYLDALMANKADIYSPAFMGEPTAVSPEIEDLSNRLATTQWVADYIASLDLSTGNTGGGNTGDEIITPTPSTPKFYYGVDTKNLMEGSGSSFTVTANKGEYVYIYYPSNTADFAVNGFVGGFEYVQSTTVYDSAYYVYRSVNSGLGTIKVTIA